MATSRKFFGEPFSATGPQRKRPRSSMFEPTYYYTNVPEEVQDLSCSILPLGQRRDIRAVDSLDSRPGVNPAIESVKAHFETSVMPENESFIRTFHRSLAGANAVSVLKEESGKEIWVVLAQHGLEVPDTHAAGREVHVVPVLERPHPQRYPYQEDIILRRIYTRRMLTLEDLELIREMFPTSVGVRVLIAGYIIILFDSKAAMESDWERGIPDSIGDLFVRYEILKQRASGTPVESGHAVTQASKSFSRLGCLGLKLRFPTGEEAITTTTHVFVKLVPSPHPILLRVADWYLRTLETIARFRAPQSQQGVPAVVSLRQPPSNTPLGKSVWLSGTNRKVGTITKTYDPLGDGPLVFPMGFTHDLSLITGPDLPRVTTRPGVAPITGWADYSAVLDGGPIFVTPLNALTGSYSTQGGTGVSAATQPAVAVGSQYIWDRDSLTQNASILWRTAYDPERWYRTIPEACSASGNPLARLSRRCYFTISTFPSKAGTRKGAGLCEETAGV